MGLNKLDDATAGGTLLLQLEKRHPLYDENLPIWEKCRDAHAGEDAIKAKKTKYLPKLNGQENSEYESYLDRAQFFGATNRTVESYLGMIFRKDPIYKYTTADGSEDDETDLEMKSFFSVITNDGKSLDDFIHDTAEEIIEVNRVGVLADMSNIDTANLTMQEYEKLGVKPMLSMYKAESIINWHWELVDNRVTPVFYVLEEQLDSFESTSLVPSQKTRYRILYLEDWDKPTRQYKVITVDKSLSESSTEGGVYKVVEVSYPKMNGEPIPFIPFFVVTDRGLENRKIHKPMILDLVNTNIGHYRNSADWENELHWVGVKTACFPGWDLKSYGNPRIGGALAVPKDSQPFLLEPKSDSGINTEMKNKEERMSVLGAERISQKGRYIPSAETARITAASEASVLSNMVRHMSKAFTAITNFILMWGVAGTENADKGTKALVTINSDFYQDDINGAELLKWMEAVQSGGISFDTYYENLRKREVYGEGWSQDKETQGILDTMVHMAKLTPAESEDDMEPFSETEAEEPEPEPDNEE